MRFNNLDTVIAELRPFLKNYLEEHNIDTTKKFNCLNPKHEDADPSMSFIPDSNGEACLCFGCGVTVDIFKAAHFLEHKPMQGKGFIYDNVIYLAEKYGIKVMMTEPTDEEIYEMSIYRAYYEAAEYIAHTKYTDLGSREIASRGWTEDFCRSHYIGTVPSFKAFREALKASGFKPSFIDDIDLGREDIFNENNLIFTIFDDLGRPVAFAARNLKYDGVNGLKYINSSGKRGDGGHAATLSGKCNIYRKGEILYGFNLIKNQGGPLYIFEGYADWATAKSSGVNNCVAVGGTAFTEKHIELLQQYNRRDIVFVFDADKGGKESILRILDKVLVGYKDIKVHIIALPDGYDPDEFIREHGIENFYALKIKTAFQWRLDQYTDIDDPIDICNTMVPIIAAEPSAVMRDQMVKELAQFTGIKEKNIDRDVERIVNAKEKEVERRKEEIIDRTIREIRFSGGDAASMLYSAAEQIKDIEVANNEDSYSKESFLDRLDNIKITQETKSSWDDCFVLGKQFKEFENKMKGEWKKDVLILVGGSPNSGKTTFLSNLSLDIAMNNDDALVIFHTIDDTMEQFVPRLVTALYGEPDSGLTINKVKNPNLYDDVDEIKDKREIGYRRLKALVEQNKYVVKDANDGTGFAYIESLIKYYIDRYPDKQIVYFLDNLHKIYGFDNSKEERVKWRTISQNMKRLATKYHIPVLCSIEYRKLQHGARPSNNDILESVQFEYDANLILHLYNELHSLRTDSVLYTLSETTRNQIPIVEVIFGKNKITDFKDSLYFNFYTDQNIYERVDRDFVFSLKRSVDSDQQKGWRTGGYA